MATSIIGTVKHLPKASVLPSLPEEGISNRIYFVPSKNPNLYVKSYKKPTVKDSR